MIVQILPAIGPNKATRKAVRSACLDKRAYPTLEAAEERMPRHQGAYRCSWADHWHRTTVRRK
jgi:hypothetical protein